MNRSPKMLVITNRFEESLTKAISNPEIATLNPQQISLLLTDQEKTLIFNGAPMDLTNVKYAYFPGIYQVPCRNLMLFLESLGITCVPNSLAYLNVISKFRTYLILSEDKEIPLVPTMLGTITKKNREAAEDVLGPLPWVEKPDMGSLGAGVKLVEDFETLTLKETDDFSHNRSLMQKYVTPNNEGRYDIRVVVYDGKVLCAEKRFADKDFRTNLSLGNHGEAYEPTLEEAALAIKCVDMFDGLMVAGVDLIYDGDKLNVLELNPFPGSKICKLTGVNFYKYIIDDLLSKS